jgi:hypothetical protein
MRVHTWTDSVAVGCAVWTHMQLAFTGFIVQAQATGKGPIACWVEHISSPMTTTLVSKGLVTPSTVIAPGCAIPAITEFQGISIPTPCLGLWP